MNSELVKISHKKPFNYTKIIFSSIFNLFQSYNSINKQSSQLKIQFKNFQLKKKKKKKTENAAKLRNPYLRNSKSRNRNRKADNISGNISQQRIDIELLCWMNPAHKIRSLTRHFCTSSRGKKKIIRYIKSDETSNFQFFFLFL